MRRMGLPRTAPKGERNMRILVVEDQPEMNALLVKQLKAAQYSVDSCLTGTDALAYLAGGEYDAVVLDIMLPGVDGLEILRRRRAAGAAARPPLTRSYRAGAAFCAPPGALPPHGA